MDDIDDANTNGSSADWEAADRKLFSWIDLPKEEVDQRLADLAHRDPDLAAAVRSRFGQLQRLGWTTDAPTMPLPTGGASFGEFRILRQLGVGGMGAVYLAEQTSLGRRVALKVVRDDRLLDPTNRERFEREARAVAELRDPGICAVLDAGEVDGTPYLAMQYIEGETLAERLAAARAAEAQRSSSSSGPTTQAAIGGMLQLIERVARSLHVAHEAGVVHRDVKPGNVMIDAYGTPVLLDFGLASVASERAATLTRTGDVLGTPAYMSPEQVQGEGRGRVIDRRTDVYSLAATLFECLTHARPFFGSTPAALWESIVRDPTPDPRQHNPHLPVDVGAVLAKAMEKDPARRYSTAADFADDLARLQRREPVRARRVGMLGHAVRWSQRNPRATSLLATLALALTTTLWLWRQTVVQREEIAVTASMAKEEAAKATAASTREQQRAAELQQVAEFQAEQLSHINAKNMGVAIRRAVLDEARRSMAKNRLAPSEIDARAHQIELLVAGTSFTDVSKTVLRTQLLDRTLQSIAKTFSEQPLVRARLLHSLADVALTLDLNEFARQPMQEARQLREQLLGEGHEDTVRSAFLAGVLASSRGECAEAIEILTRVLEISRQASHTRDMVRTLLELSKACAASGRVAEQRAHLQAAHELGADLNPEDPLVFELGFKRVAGRVNRGEFDGIEQECRQLLARSEAVLGRENQTSIRLRNQLGQILTRGGSLEEAEALLRANLEITIQEGGRESWEASFASLSFAQWLVAAARYTEAAVLLTDSLALSELVNGPDDRITLVLASNLADCHQRTGKLDLAEATARRALDGSRRTRGNFHSDTLNGLVVLGSILLDRRKLDEAEACIDEALESARESQGQDSRIALEALSWSSRVSLEKGDLDAADVTSRDLLDRRRRVSGNGPDVQLDMHMRANVLWMSKRYAECEPLRRQCHEWCRQRLGPSHPDSVATLRALGEVLEAQDKLDEAEACAREWVQIALQSPGPAGGEPHAVLWLVRLLEAQAKRCAIDQAAQALAKLKEAEKLLLPHAGSGTAATRSACERLASVYDAWHAMRPAEGLDQKARSMRERAQVPSGGK